MRILTVSLGWFLSIVVVASAADDVVIADFEGEDYGAWRVSGEAFNSKPAQGTLPNQQPVSGFEGKGLVNSYLNGDGTVGKLTSPEFTIERKYVNFLGDSGYLVAERCRDWWTGLVGLRRRVVRTCVFRTKESVVVEKGREF